MWVARDKNGELGFFTWKPVRYKDFWGEDDLGPSISDSCSLPKKMFPELTWEDEPLQVNLYDDNVLFRFISETITEYDDNRHPDPNYLKEKFKEYVGSKR